MKHPLWMPKSWGLEVLERREMIPSVKGFAP